MMQPFGQAFSGRHSIGGAISVNPPTPVRVVSTQQGPPGAPSPNLAPPRAKLDRNNSLTNMSKIASNAGMRKSASTDNLNGVLNGKASASPRVDGTSPGPKQSQALQKTVVKRQSANAEASATEIRTSSTRVETPRSNNQGSKQPEQGGQRSLVVSKTPPRQPHRRNSLNSTPRAPIAPEDIGHFVGTIGDSIDRNAQYPRGRYCIIKKLGAGVYGKVLECEDRKYNARVAVKIIRREPPVYREAVKKEIKVLLDLDGTYGTLKMLRTFEHQGHVCLSLELLGIPLSDRMKDTNEGHGLPLDDIRDIGLQLFHAMEYVHRRGVIHTDIKPDNILIAREKNADGSSAIRVKMVDFGSAISRGEWHPPLIGTLEYRAPESVLQAGYNQLVDIWALGCVIVELHTGRVLFRGASRQETEGHLLVLMEVALGRRLPEVLLRKGAGNRNAHNAPFLNRNGHGHPAIARTLKRGGLPYQTVRSVVKDDELRDLVLKTLCMEPEKRYTASEAKAHAFFKNSLLDASSIDEFGHLKSHARRAKGSAEPSPKMEREGPAEATSTKEAQAQAESAAEAEANPKHDGEDMPSPRVETPETVETVVRRPETPEEMVATAPEEVTTPEVVPVPRRLPERAPTPPEAEASNAEAASTCAAEAAVGAAREEAEVGAGSRRLSQEGSLHASTSTVSVENLPDELRSELDEAEQLAITPRAHAEPREAEALTPEVPRAAGSDAPNLKPDSEFAQQALGLGPLAGLAVAVTVGVTPTPSLAEQGHSTPREGMGMSAAPPPLPGSISVPKHRPGSAAPPPIRAAAPMPEPGSVESAGGARTVRVRAPEQRESARSLMMAPQAPMPPIGTSLDGGARRPPPPPRPSMTSVHPPPPAAALPRQPPPPSGAGLPGHAAPDRAALVDWHSRRIDDLDMRLRENAKKTANPPPSPGREGQLRENINANGQPSSPIGKAGPGSPTPKVGAVRAVEGAPYPGSPLRQQLRPGSLKGVEAAVTPTAEQALRQALQQSEGFAEDGAGASAVESEVEHKLRSLRQFINEAMQEGLYRGGKAPPPPTTAGTVEVGSSQESAVSTVSTVWLGDEERKVDADGRVLGMDEANAYLL